MTPKRLKIWKIYKGSWSSNCTACIPSRESCMRRARKSLKKHYLWRR